MIPYIAMNTFEPGIEEILEDPIFRQLMQTDGVEESTLHTLLRETAEGMRRKPQLCNN
jgi:hypothetical protein